MQLFNNSLVLFDPSTVSLLLVFNYHDTSISNLIVEQELMILCEVGVTVEYVQQVLTQL